MALVHSLWLIVFWIFIKLDDDLERYKISGGFEVWPYCTICLRLTYPWIPMMNGLRWATRPMFLFFVVIVLEKNKLGVTWKCPPKAVVFGFGIWWSIWWILFCNHQAFRIICNIIAYLSHLESHTTKCDSKAISQYWTFKWYAVNKPKIF